MNHVCDRRRAIDLHRRLSRDDLAGLASVMRDTMAHRGPDDAGLWIDPEGGCALGHRRLVDHRPERGRPAAHGGGGLQRW